MDGIHDLGGKHGHGKVEFTPSAPVFHARWEAAVFAMVNAGARPGAWNNADRFRHPVERIDPVAYLSHGYYGRWLGGLETLLVEAGIITTEELEARLPGDLQAATMRSNGRIAARPETAPDPVGPMPQATGSQRTLSESAQFHIGDRVITTAEVKPGHTRLPAYARGKVGQITSEHGAWIYPDTNAHGLGECPNYLYTVSFKGAELWPGGDPLLTVSLDLFEPYLAQVV